MLTSAGEREKLSYKTSWLQEGSLEVWDSAAACKHLVPVPKW